MPALSVHEVVWFKPGSELQKKYAMNIMIKE